MPPWSKVTKKSPSTSKTRRSATRATRPKSSAGAHSVGGRLRSALALLWRACARRSPSATDAFVERLFAKGDEYLHDTYATIGDAARFHTKLAGVSFEGRQDVIAGLHAGAPLELRRQADNPHDSNAIAVHYGQLQLGFFNRRLAAHIAPLMDAGARYGARVASLTGGGSGGEFKHRGVNVVVEREALGVQLQRADAAAAQRPDVDGDAAETGERVRSALIGASAPHEAQRAVLERVEAGKNTLAVLGTGRGKSFCFQYAAAMRAFTGGGKTLVVYPLRALANDQFEALRRTLEPLGLRFFRANGSIDSDEREDLFAALREGSWDVVLATPEFLEFHREAFRGRSTPSFVVVDEAHHLAESRHRPAYSRLAATISSLGNPPVLALTATAGDETFRRIVDDLRIESWVIDPTVRANLHVADARGTKDKIGYLTELFSAREGPPEKGIIYCHSRPEVTKVAQRLRKHTRQQGDVLPRQNAQRRAARGRTPLSRGRASRRSCDVGIRRRYRFARRSQRRALPSQLRLG